MYNYLRNVTNWSIKTAISRRQFGSGQLYPIYSHIDQRLYSVKADLLFMSYDSLKMRGKNIVIKINNIQVNCINNKAKYLIPIHQN